MVVHKVYSRLIPEAKQALSLESTSLQLGILYLESHSAGLARSGLQLAWTFLVLIGAADCTPNLQRFALHLKQPGLAVHPSFQKFGEQSNLLTQDPRPPAWRGA